MKRRSAIRIFAVLVWACLATSCAAQDKPAPTYESVIANQWRSIHDKILAMAKDTQFPDDKLGWKPHPDSRSVLEELRHVTIGLEMTTAQARGEKFDFEAREQADASKP